MQSAKARQVCLFRRLSSVILDKMGVDSKRCKITPQLGRNFSAIVETKGGDCLFVKIITGVDASERFDRTISFFAAGKKPLGMCTPLLIEEDRESFAVVNEVVEDATKMSLLVTDGELDGHIWATVGAGIAVLHAWNPDDSSIIDSTIPLFPPTRSDLATSLDFYENASSGQIELLLMLQRDKSVRDAIVELLTLPYNATPIHGDLRTDQILLRDNNFWIIDWEDFRIGDPARDLGSILGEIFFHYMRPLIHQASDGGSVTAEGIVSSGMELLERVKPSISALWSGYTNSIVMDSKEMHSFIDRVIGFMGWQMFDRSLSLGGVLGQISGVEKALMGMGRQMLLYRGSYAPVLGIELVA